MFSFESYDEELKISLMIARNWGATLYAEDEMLRKSCALGDDFVDAMEATIEVRLGSCRACGPPYLIVGYKISSGRKKVLRHMFAEDWR